MLDSIYIKTIQGDINFGMVNDRTCCWLDAGGIGSMCNSQWIDRPVARYNFLGGGGDKKSQTAA